ncbi:MAG: hypothetical protein AAFR81_15195 [Chloroflexota bacterium]
MYSIGMTSEMYCVIEIQGKLPEAWHMNFDGLDMEFNDNETSY